MKLKIAVAGEPVLRQGARPLRSEEIGSEAIASLVQHMRETLADAPGVGLAAPQIGEALQLAIIEDKAAYQANLSTEELAERGRVPIDFHVLMNPELELLSPSDVIFFEGCLSLPGYVAIVPRAQRVRVRALDQNGQPVQIEAEGWYARILQHELDHLNGTLYLDRMWTRSFCSMDQYTRHWKSATHDTLREAFQPGTK